MKHNKNISHKTGKVNIIPLLLDELRQIIVSFAPYKYCRCKVDRHMVKGEWYCGYCNKRIREV